MCSVRIRFGIALLTIWTAIPSTAVAQPADSPPVAISAVAGKTGAFRITLPERSPLSAPAEIAKRLQLKPADIGGDYDLSKQIFDLYIPAEPAADGKYGLLDAVVFNAAHGFVPPAWRPVLDKYHLIWIGPSNCGDNRPDAETIGYALDIAHNATKTWQLDPNRIYVSINSGRGRSCGIGLFYPDVFGGVINSLWMAWFVKLQDSERPPRIWSTDRVPRPLDAQFAMAKARTRFFFASRDEGENNNLNDELIFKKGYQQSGFKHIKMIKVPFKDMYLWSNYTADWLEEGIKFLDASASEINASPEPVAEPTKAPRAATQPTAVRLGSAPPNNAAASALSLAKNYVTARRYDLARRRLQKIISDYPNTPTAKEAAALWKEIEGK